MSAAHNVSKFLDRLCELIALPFLILAILVVPPILWAWGKLQRKPS